MSVEIVREPHDDPPAERCCFCRAVTPFWVINMDVACCKECAARAHPGDVPKKADWIRRERIADHSIAAWGWQSQGPRKP